PPQTGGQPVRQCRRPRSMRRTFAGLARPAAAGLLGLALAFAAGCGSSRSQASGANRSASRSARPSPGRSVTPAPRPSCGTPRGSPAVEEAADSGGPAKPTLNAVQFVGSSEGWVVGSDRILHTTDGGQHWVTQYLTRPKAGLATVDFTDASHGWVVGGTTI